MINIYHFKGNENSLKRNIKIHSLEMTNFTTRRNKPQPMIILYTIIINRSFIYFCQILNIFVFFFVVATSESIAQLVAK